MAHAEAQVARWSLDTTAYEIAADLRSLPGEQRFRAAGAVALNGGRTAVLDAGTPRVLYFDRGGTLEHIVELQSAGQRRGPRPDRLGRVVGDTIAATGLGGAFVLDGQGKVLRAFNAHSVSAVPAGIRVALAALTGGRFVLGLIGPQTPPAPGVNRWVDSITVVVIDSTMAVETSLGRWPALVAANENGRSRQVWLAPHGAVASRDSTIYYGFGSEYRIDAFTSDGRLLHSFSRPWTRVPVTDADIDAYIEGWSTNWMKGPPDEVARRKVRMRADPYFEYIPAFSEILVSSRNELWVRTPSLTDAQSAGELNHPPLVPSHWTVFDQSGRWIAEITLPAQSHPRDVHGDFVLTVEHGANGGKVVRRGLLRGAR